MIMKSYSENPKFLLFSSLAENKAEKSVCCGKKSCCEKYKRKGKHCKSCPKL